MSSEINERINNVVRMVLCSSMSLVDFLGVPLTSDTKTDIVIGVLIFGIFTGIFTGIFISVVFVNICA